MFCPAATLRGPLSGERRLGAGKGVGHALEDVQPGERLVLQRLRRALGLVRAEAEFA